jgi:nicotinate-nucleotide adenylyltransferase
MRTIGILGGTFDPVHNAHLAAAMAAKHQLELDQVLLVIANEPWQKNERALAPADVRYEMVARAIEDVAGLEASSIELERPGPTYTIDTVEQLQGADTQLVLILGSDVATRLNTWHRADELRELVTIAVVGRGEGGGAPPGWRACTVAMPRLDISSTDLRRRVAAGEPVEFLMPLPAVRLLRERGLYTADR